LRVEGLRFRVHGSGFRVQGSGFRAQSSGFRVQGLELNVRVYPNSNVVLNASVERTWNT
jgi:hypothetical protein